MLASDRLLAMQNKTRSKREEEQIKGWRGFTHCQVAKQKSKESEILNSTWLSSTLSVYIYQDKT